MPVLQTSVALGRRLAEVRERKGMQQKELAAKAGLSATFLSEIENGKRNVSSEVLLRLADALGASIDYLLRGKESASELNAPVAIPAELSELAQRQGWSFAQTLALLDIHRAVLLGKGEKGATDSELAPTDWLKLYKRFF